MNEFDLATRKIEDPFEKQSKRLCVFFSDDYDKYKINMEEASGKSYEVFSSEEAFARAFLDQDMADFINKKKREDLSLNIEENRLNFFLKGSRFETEGYSEFIEYVKFMLSKVKEARKQTSGEARKCGSKRYG